MKRIRWPRIENDEHIMAADSVRPLIDALPIAYVELIDCLVADYGFDRMHAYQIASQADRVRVANFVGQALRTLPVALLTSLSTPNAATSNSQ